MSETSLGLFASQTLKTLAFLRLGATPITVHGLFVLRRLVVPTRLAFALRLGDVSA